MIYLLAKYPIWQRSYARYRAIGHHLSFDEIAELETFEWVIKETLRMVPPLPTMPRRVLKDTHVRG